LSVFLSKFDPFFFLGLFFCVFMIRRRGEKERKGKGGQEVMQREEEEEEMKVKES
jgi:hypothetical protein